MNRAERRRQERRSKEYDSRKTFTKNEVETMNNAAYEHGLVFALRAAARIDGIGEKRLAQIKQEILAIEFESGISRGVTPNWANLSKKDLKEGAGL